MNPLTHQLLERLWSGDPNFATIEVRLKKECQSLSPVEAAVIGKDLIRRRSALFTKNFKLAAFLASDGEAGNDGFLDFTDCVAILPEDRYRRIIENPDELIDDPVSRGFDELRLVSEVSQVFDRALLDEEADGLLDYLVSDDTEVDWDEIQSGTDTDAKERLPRLYAKYGHLLKGPTKSVMELAEDRVRLTNLTGTRPASNRASKG